MIGQSKFGADVYQLLRKQGHEIVGVFTIPDKDGRPDLLGKFYSLWFTLHFDHIHMPFVADRYRNLLFLFDMIPGVAMKFVKPMMLHWYQ